MENDAGTAALTVTEKAFDTSEPQETRYVRVDDGRQERVALPLLSVDFTLEVAQVLPRRY
jgi:hypothetical protein